MDLWDPAYVTMRPASGPCIPSALAVLHPRRDLGLGELQARGPSFFFFSSPVLEALCFSDSGPSLQKGPVMVHPHQRYAPEQRAPSFARVGEEERGKKAEKNPPCCYSVRSRLARLLEGEGKPGKLVAKDDLFF